MIIGAIVAVDFDNTLTGKSKFPRIGELREGAREALEFIRQHNKVVLWTCREGEYLVEAMDFLKRNGIAVDGVNVDLYGDPRRKIYADIYIDDRNIFVDEIDWHQIKKWFIRTERNYHHRLPQKGE